MCDEPVVPDAMRRALKVVNDQDYRRLYLQRKRLRQSNRELVSALRDLADRCERAREILRGQGRVPWGMLDTANARKEITKATGEGD